MIKWTSKCKDKRKKFPDKESEISASQNLSYVKSEGCKFWTQGLGAGRRFRDTFQVLFIPLWVDTII